MKYSIDPDSSLWHARLGHPSKDRQNYLTNIPKLTENNCDPCKISKMKSIPHKRSLNNNYTPGQLVVGDYKLLRKANLDGTDTGFFILMDVSTRYNALYQVQGKDQQQECFQQFQNYLKTQFNLEIKKFRHDQGKEYLNKEFQNYLTSNGIEDQTTSAYSPESNGIAESRFRVLTQMATSMLAHANLSENFMAAAFKTASYIFNRIPMSDGKIPLESISGTKPRIDHLRVFGCKSFYLLPKAKRIMSSTLGRQFPGRVARFIGYAPNTASYLLWDKALEKSVISRDVIFDEHEFSINYQDFISEPPPEHAWLPSPDSIEHPHSDHRQEVVSTEVVQEPTPETSQQDQLPVPRGLESNLGPAWELRRSSRRNVDAHTVENIENVESINLVSIVESIYSIYQVPSSFFKIKDLPPTEQKRWYNAVKEELNKLKQLETYEVIPKTDVPKDIQILDTVYVFTQKGVEPKARLCVRGDLEEEFQPLKETFSTVARTENFRLLLTLIAFHSWSFYIVDVKSAFINASLSSPSFIKIPLGATENRNSHVWKLKKALYGLRRSPAEWNRELSGTMLSLGFTKSKSDWNFFLRKTQGTTIFIAFHVDDGIITSNNQKTLDEVIQALAAKYDLKVNEKPDSFLGISLFRDKQSNLIYLNQKNYIDACVEKFHCPDRRYTVPMDPGFEPKVTEVDSPLENNTQYRSIVGALLHIARMTRPDILYAVSILTKFFNNPQQRHWSAAKRVLSYLRDTKEESLALGKLDPTGQLTLSGYCDATWGDDQEYRRSRSGGVLFLCGSMISSWSKQQATVALSSAEAEYQSASLILQEILYFKQFMDELGIYSDGPIPIYCDNKGAIDLTISTKNHPRIKHIDIRFHFIREQVELKLIDFHYVHTSDQIADIFTKALPAHLFNKLKSKLSVQLWRGVGK